MHRSNNQQETHHLECVQLFLDLLSKHWRQAVARRDVTTAIVLPARPCLKGDDAGAEGGVALQAALRGSGRALGVLAETEGRNKVILTANGDRRSPSVSLLLIIGGAGSAGGRGIGDVRSMRRFCTAWRWAGGAIAVF